MFLLKMKFSVNPQNLNHVSFVIYFVLIVHRHRDVNAIQKKIHKTCIHTWKQIGGQSKW